MTSAGRCVAGAVLLVATLFSRSTQADPSLPGALEGIGIEDRVGATLPRDVKLRNQEGHDVVLGDYLEGDRPLVVVLAYYECPMLCSMVINGLLDGMKAIEQTAGKDYRVLVVSFDPRDTVETAAKKREAYVRAYGRPIDPRGWDFMVGEPREVQRLADSLGFSFRWDDKTQQYAHAAAAFVVTPDARLSRTLYGVSFPSKNLNLAVREASLGHLGSAVDRVLLFCFHYDPLAGSYVLATRRLMTAGGALTLTVLSLWLFGMWRADKRRALAIAEQRS
jgi:protein SCO1/2